MRKEDSKFPKKLVLKMLPVVGAMLLVLPFLGWAEEGAGLNYDSERILVKFKKPPLPRELRAFRLAHQLQLEKIIPRINVFRFTKLSGLTVQEIVDKVKANNLIDFAEPDYMRYPSYTPNDPLFTSQWDMILMGLPLYWDIEKGVSKVVVAVLDTGIDLDHPDLVNQLWQNPGEIPGNRVDDDSNGYTDDFNGYDFAGDGLFPRPGAEDPNPEDLYVGHGTHVSGTIAAQQDNNEGISGEAPGVKIMAVRALGGILGAGYSSDIAESIIYAADNGAKVINMSLGGTAKSLTEYSALQYAWDHNVFIAAAAGNDGDSGNSLNYPAAYVFAMSVGATDSADNIAPFSTHNEFVEISAPGVQILSTVPGGAYESAIWSGTSMATPHAAGLAALLYSRYSDLKNWQARLMLQGGVIDPGATGWDEFFGFGRADCGLLIETAVPSDEVLKIITPPEGVTFRSDALLSGLWNPVSGAARYRVTITLPNGDEKVRTITTPYVTASPYVSLPMGDYSVTVQAEDHSGTVIASDSVSFSR